jgi:hypothetical protein
MLRVLSPLRSIKKRAITRYAELNIAKGVTLTCDELIEESLVYNLIDGHVFPGYRLLVDYF